MPQLEFMDCPYCKKRVASTATVCRHCGNSPKGSEQKGNNATEEAGDDSESHQASSFGGYDAAQDDFDYDEFIAEEFPSSDSDTKTINRWKYVSILLIFVFVILLLVQIL